MRTAPSLRSSRHAAAFRAGRAGFAFLTLLSLIFAAFVERQSPVAALVVLLLCTGSIGIFHGVLDVVLLTLPRQFTPQQALLATQPGFRNAVWLRLSAYGLAVVALLVVLGSQPAWAMVALLVMSAWHFGEVFSDSLHRGHSVWWYRAGERLTLGAASVALPRLIQSESLYEIVSLICGPNPAAMSLVWQAWTLLAVVWLVVGTLWFLASTVRLLRSNFDDQETKSLAKSLRWAALHTVLLTLVYALVSPVMGFALYFGLYHSPAHILRVIRAYPTGFTVAIRWQLGAVYALTLVLAALTFQWVTASRFEFLMSSSLLQTYVIVITAISLPHIFLVSQRADEL